MNASFQSNNTFRDLINGEDVFLGPIIKWNISPQTQATLEMEYQHERKSMDQQILPYDPQKGFVDIPFSRNLVEHNLTETENIFVGFNWSHQFNDDWSIKHQSTFKRQDVDTGVVTFPADISLATHEVSRFVGVNKVMGDTVSTNLDLTGHFNTWGLEHSLLFGGDYYRFANFLNQSYFNNSTINYNHPIHPAPDLTINAFTVNDNFKTTTDNYGVYQQDQIKLPYHFHVMGGLRYQYIHSTINSDTFSNYPSTTNSALAPRVGLL
jgi:iron complex outermembrane recepter protein